MKVQTVQASNKPIKQEGGVSTKKKTKQGSKAKEVSPKDQVKLSGKATQVQPSETEKTKSKGVSIGKIDANKPDDPATREKLKSLLETGGFNFSEREKNVLSNILKKS